MLLTGSLDELRIFSRALSAIEVRTAFQLNSFDSAALELYYSFADPLRVVSGLLADRSGFGRNATFPTALGVIHHERGAAPCHTLDNHCPYESQSDL